jgi:L-threonylcarbamoyladenylate synthase
VGIESTIIDCTKDHPVVLRPGAITAEMIEQTTGIKVYSDPAKIRIKASGLFESHYSPKAKVVIGTATEPGNGFIAMANCPTPTGAVRLASPENIEQYARNFYSALREGDRRGLKKITVTHPDGEGLAAAIRDRSNKAASGK